MSNEKTETIKAILIAAQRPAITKEQIIDDVVAGKVKLLTAEQISERIGIDEAVFTLWVKQSTDDYHPRKPRKELGKDKMPLMATFPKPDIYIAGEARWTQETFKMWLIQQNIR